MRSKYNTYNYGNYGTHNPHMAVQEYTSKLFIYDKASKTLVAEMSELGLRTVPTYICVKSENTGKVVRFGNVEIERDADGDITALKYISTDPTVAASVAILND